MRRLCLALAPALLAVSSGAFAQERPLAGLEAALAAEAEAGFGGAVVVQQGDRILLAEGYGLADREKGVPFTPDTIAQVGSITKTFTGLAVARLVSEGRLSLDAPVSDYAPQVPEPARSVTIRQLLSHSAGLREYCGDDLAPVPLADFLEDCLASPLLFVPGEGNEYSNVGFGLLALVIQEVSGQSWEAYLRGHVWTPLGMHSTGFAEIDPGSRIVAKGYLHGVEQVPLLPSLQARDGADWSLRGNGGAQASARDMLALANGIAGDAPEELAAALALLRQPITEAEDGVAEGYGLAFRFHEDGSIRRGGHAGSDGTFYSYIGWLPDNDIRFYFVGNNGEEEVVETLRILLRALAEIPPAAAAQ